MFTFSPHTNNNPNQPNPNNQTNMSSAPSNPPNNSFGNPAPQTTAFGSTGSGSLFPNPQPSGGVFSNQQSQGGGGSLFGSQSQNVRSALNNVVQNVPLAGPGGHFDPGIFNTFAPITRIPANGTVDFIARNNLHQLEKTRDGHRICSMTARIKGHSLDELRMTDYFNLKNNTLKLDEKSRIRFVIRENLRNLEIPGMHEQFLSGLPPTLAALWSDLNQNSKPKPESTSGYFSMDSQLSQNTPSSSLVPQDFSSNFMPNLSSSQKNTDSLTQVIMKRVNMEASNKPDAGQPETKDSETKKMMKPTAKAKSENKILNSGSFNYEFNKMLFVSGLVQTMEKHNMRMPENLLDDTDFVPQLLEFLKQYDISLPTENVPQFEINSIHLLTGSKSEENECD